MTRCDDIWAVENDPQTYRVRRTAATDIELDGRQVKHGGKVVSL